MSEVTTIVTCPYCKSVSTERRWTPPNIGRTPSAPTRRSIHHTGGTGLQMTNSQDIVLEDCLFEDLDTGISAENSDLHGRRNMMRGTRRGIYAKNSIVDMPDLVIE